MTPKPGYVTFPFLADDWVAEKLSKREIFAALAMTAILIRGAYGGNDEEYPVEGAVVIADRLIKELNDDEQP